MEIKLFWSKDLTFAGTARIQSPGHVLPVSGPAIFSEALVHLAKGVYANRGVMDPRDGSIYTSSVKIHLDDPGFDFALEGALQVEGLCTEASARVIAANRGVTFPEEKQEW